MTATCDRCGQPVIQPPDCPTLDQEPHAEGVYLPNGRTINPLDAVQAYWGTGPAVGHRVHRCPAIEGRRAA